MITLNLLPDLKKEYIHAQKMRNVVISGAIMVSIAAGAAVVLLAVTVYGVQAGIMAVQRGSIDSNHAKLSKLEDINKYLTVQNQLGAIEAAGPTRAVYFRLFDYLQQLNPASPYNVSLYSAKIDKATSVIEINGGAPTFEAVNNFKNAIENAKLVYKKEGADQKEQPFFTINDVQADLSNTGAKPITNFKFVLAFTPDAFDPMVSDAHLVVPKMTTSDADKNAPKLQPVFTAPPQEGENNGR